MDNTTLENISTVLVGFRDDTVNFALICLTLAMVVPMIVEVLKFVFRSVLFRRYLGEWAYALGVRGQAEAKALGGLLPRSVQADLLTEPELGFLTLVQQDAHPWTCLVGKGRREEFRSNAGLFHFAPHVYNLPRSLFMRQMENAAQQALDNPGHNGKALFYLADGATVEDRVRLIARTVGQPLSESEPPPGDEASKRKSDPASRVTVAGQRVTAAVERTLDELQLMISQKWLRAVRFAAVLVGVGLALWLGVETGALSDSERARLVVAGKVAATFAILYVLLQFVLPGVVASASRKVFDVLPLKVILREPSNLTVTVAVIGSISILVGVVGPSAPEDHPHTFLFLIAIGAVAGLISTVLYDLIQRLTRRDDVA